jgi:hypothetical protein
MNNSTDKLDARSRARQVLLMQMWEKVKARTIAELRDLALLYKVSPGLPAQYLYGHVALNEKWMLRFALYLRMAPQEIWPDWEYKELTHAPRPDLILVNDCWSGLTPGTRSRIVALCKA